MAKKGLLRWPKKASVKYACDNCNHVWKKYQLKKFFPNIPNLLMRLDVGGIVPAAECPDCGALVYKQE